MTSRRTRVSSADLRLAATWLRAYEDHPDDVGDPEAPGAVCARVAAQLEAEAARREEAVAIRTTARELGTTPARVRDALRRVRARQEEEAST